jgi:periplasmic copper chaperone A
MYFCKKLLQCVTIVALLSTAAAAETKKTGPWKIEGILVEQAWARIAPGAAKTGAVYLTIHNTSLTDDLLLAVASPAARNTAVHHTVVEGDIAKMKPMPFGVEVKAQSEVILKPGSIHIMLSNLSGALEPGDQLPVTMVFQEAGTLELDVPVLRLGAKDPAVSHGGHKP